MRQHIMTSVSIFLGALLLASPTASATVLMSDVQINKVMTSCTTAASYLRRIEQADKVLRVNLGQRYDTMDRRMMDPMNNRIAANGLDAAPFVAITQEYETQVNEFRKAYSQYETTLMRTLDINCVEQPVNFYNNLSQVRQERTVVYDKTKQIDAQVAQYRAELMKLGYTPVAQ